jgi:hypothetical protein
MHCIQGSDAHRLGRDRDDPNRLGWGDRVTEIALPEPTFDAIKAVLLGEDFSQTRPYRPAEAPFDHVQAAREEGPSIVQAFHEGMTQRGGRLHAILRDVVAMANTNGGTVYVGVKSDPKAPPIGVSDPDEAIAALRTEIQRKITPSLDVKITTVETHGQQVLQLSVPLGENVPYAIDGTTIYLRQEAETHMAMRDEIVALAQRALVVEPVPCSEGAGEEKVVQSGGVEPPRTGVQILETVERKGIRHHTMKDLRNGNVVHDVTRSSARKLWRYAITEHESNPIQEDRVQWVGNLGLCKSSSRAGKVRYDLVQRMADGQLHVY